MKISRKGWSSHQKELRTLLSDPNSHSQAIELFLQQHAEVHSGAMSSYGIWSFEDEVLADLADGPIRELPDRMDHSIAWIIWHIARIEDVTMNMLVAGKEQLFTRDAWMSRLGISAQHTGNAMSKREIVALSKVIDIDSLRSYRAAVGRQTEMIVREFQPDEIGRKVPSSRLDRVVDAEAVRTEARGLLDYWGRRTIAGLLLMPPTRHCFVHLNEAERIKRRVM